MQFQPGYRSTRSLQDPRVCRQLKAIATPVYLHARCRRHDEQYRHCCCFGASTHKHLGSRSQRKFKAAENRSQMFGVQVQCLRDSSPKGQLGLEADELPEHCPEDEESRPIISTQPRDSCSTNTILFWYFLLAD